jgi:hypothetical protein
MLFGWTGDIGEGETQRKRLSALAALLVISGISMALWSAIISAAIQVP